MAIGTQEAGFTQPILHLCVIVMVWLHCGKINKTVQFYAFLHGGRIVVVVVFAARLVVDLVGHGRRHHRPRRVPPQAPLLGPLFGAGFPTEI